VVFYRRKPHVPRIRDRLTARAAQGGAAQGGRLGRSRL